MRKNHLYIIALLLLVLLAACDKQKSRETRERPAFTIDLRLPTTPVKDQGHTSLCWIYAMLATIETEHITQGDSVNLSVDYVARAFLREQALEGYQTDNWNPTTRGMASMTIRLLETYGLTHHDAYHHKEELDLGVLLKKLRIAKGAATTLADFTKKMDAQLDQSFGEVMPRVFFLGVQYTPLEFAHSVCRDDEYEALTSFSHHPFGTRFPLEVPDNHYHDCFLNVPLDTLASRVEQSLRRGHPVCWEGDISEAGFSFTHGVATLKHNKVISQAERQQQFEKGQTTDDHCMEIVGMAHDRQGHAYFLLKNSWGANNPYGGYMYMSRDYFLLKTIAVYMPT